jgi:MFS family permease
MLAAGLGLFTAASAACALSPGAGALITARAVQGAGAALVLPLSLSLLSAAFPPQRRAWALGIFSSVTGLAVLAGPVIGGAVAQGLSWQWIFWLNIPIGLVMIPLVLAGIGASAGGRAGLDRAAGPAPRRLRWARLVYLYRPPKRRFPEAGSTFRIAQRRGDNHAQHRESRGATALVTGASRGFGRGIATALSRAGARVAGVARGRAQLQELRAELGESFTPVTADAADPTVAGQLIDADRPSILVLNAGATPLPRPIQYQSWQTFSRNWDVDVQHVFHWARELLAHTARPGKRRYHGV